MRKVDEDFARRLKITSFGEDGLTYYSLYTGGYWDILGFCDFADERIAIRLLHFEDEFLDDESFVAEQLPVLIFLLMFLDVSNFCRLSNKLS